MFNLSDEGWDAYSEAALSIVPSPHHGKADPGPSCRRRRPPEHAALRQDDERYGDKLAATNIRIELRRAFPRVKFSVRVLHYGSITIRWTGGPTRQEVEVIADRYQSDHFDGMEDIYHTPALALMRGIWRRRLHVLQPRNGLSAGAGRKNDKGGQGKNSCRSRSDRFAHHGAPTARGVGPVRCRVRGG